MIKIVAPAYAKIWLSLINISIRTIITRQLLKRFEQIFVRSLTAFILLIFII